MSERLLRRAAEALTSIGLAQAHVIPLPIGLGYPFIHQCRRLRIRTIIKRIQRGEFTPALFLNCTAYTSRIRNPCKRTAISQISRKVDRFCVPYTSTDPKHGCTQALLADLVYLSLDFSGQPPFSSYTKPPLQHRVSLTEPSQFLPPPQLSSAQQQARRPFPLHISGLLSELLFFLPSLLAPDISLWLLSVLPQLFSSLLSRSLALVSHVR